MMRRDRAPVPKAQIFAQRLWDRHSIGTAGLDFAQMILAKHTSFRRGKIDFPVLAFHRLEGPWRESKKIGQLGPEGIHREGETRRQPSAELALSNVSAMSPVSARAQRMIQRRAGGSAAAGVFHTRGSSSGAMVTRERKNTTLPSWPVHRLASGRQGILASDGHESPASVSDHGTSSLFKAPAVQLAPAATESSPSSSPMRETVSTMGAERSLTWPSGPIHGVPPGHQGIFPSHGFRKPVAREKTNATFSGKGEGSQAFSVREDSPSAGILDDTPFLKPSEPSMRLTHHAFGAPVGSTLRTYPAQSSRFTTPVSQRRVAWASSTRALGPGGPEKGSNVAAGKNFVSSPWTTLMLPLSLTSEVFQSDPSVGPRAESTLALQTTGSFARGEGMNFPTPGQRLVLEREISSLPPIPDKRPATELWAPSVDLTLHLSKASVSPMPETSAAISAARQSPVRTGEAPTRLMHGESRSAVQSRPLSVPEVAEKVYRLLERRWVIERERRGVF